MFRSLTARFPSEIERNIILKSLAAIRAEYKDSPKKAEELLAHGESPVDKSIPAVELASWTLLANQIFNLDEVITKE